MLAERGSVVKPTRPGLARSVRCGWRSRPGAGGRADSRVDEYIGRLPDWQQQVCQQVRRLVHAADPEVEETTKRSVRQNFVLKGIMCALVAAKDHVKVFI